MSIRLYGFWRSLATYRVRTALALKGDWMGKALEAIEGHLAKEQETGRFCHGDAPTLADICLASQVIGAFDRSQPTKQPDAPANPAH